MITIVLPISRKTYLKPVFDCLDNLERPKDTELLIITDGDISLQQAVDKRLDSISYRRIQVVNFGDGAAESIDDRRYRIAAIHNKARHYISDECDYVFSIEDDTVYPKDTISKLYQDLTHDPDVMFSQGVELGRHNTPYVGGWAVDDVYDPSHVLSVMPTEYKEIDAGGLYCALIDAELYKMHQFEPYDKKGRNGLGCDFNFGLYLRQQGYKCWINWSVSCDHIGDKGSVNLGNTNPRQVQFTKTRYGFTAETI